MKCEKTYLLINICLLKCDLILGLVCERNGVLFGFILFLYYIPIQVIEVLLKTGSKAVAVLQSIQRKSNAHKHQLLFTSLSVERVSSHVRHRPFLCCETPPLCHGAQHSTDNTLRAFTDCEPYIHTYIRYV